MVTGRLCASSSLIPVLDLGTAPLSGACLVADSASRPSLECAYTVYRVREGEPGTAHRAHPYGFALTSIACPPGFPKLSDRDAHEGHCFEFYGELQW